MGVSGADFTALVGAASSPWALKPILGFVNEALPIYGYKSRFCEWYRRADVRWGEPLSLFRYTVRSIPTYNPSTHASIQSTRLHRSQLYRTTHHTDVIFLGVVATIAYALLALSSGDGSTPEIVSFLFFLASLQISWTDLMVEGVCESSPPHITPVVVALSLHFEVIDPTTTTTTTTTHTHPYLRRHGQDGTTPSLRP